jgi:hypothetical protein
MGRALSVDQYYQSLLAQVAELPSVRSSELTHDVRGEFVAFIRGNIYFTDDSLLHLRELVDAESDVKKTRYVYHYQRANNSLVFRYDNTEHYPDLPNFPHHKHVGDEANVISTPEPDLAIVLKEIEGLVTTDTQTG